jgi:hypothetical protein
MTVLAYPVGATPNLTLTVDPAAADTAATVVLDAPTGVNQNPTATLGDAVPGSTARTLTATGATLDEAGTWYAVWTVTGTGHGTAVQEIRVTAVPVAGTTPTFDPTTAVGQVRLLISDIDPANLVFSDAELTAFLTLNAAAVRLAAAQALETIAGNELLVTKVMRTQDLQVDASKVSAELRALAVSLRSQHEAGYGDSGSGFEIVDFDPYSWGAAELVEWPRY